MRGYLIAFSFFMLAASSAAHEPNRQYLDGSVVHGIAGLSAHRQGS